MSEGREEQAPNREMQQHYADVLQIHTPSASVMLLAADALFT
jgi:hypothetical protein